MDKLYILYIISIALIIPALIYMLVVQVRVKSVFSKYDIPNSRGLRAEEVARRILDAEGLTNVRIGRINGKLTDNFNPSDNTVYLSDSVFGSTSLSAIGVAAHECGHAIQHAQRYLPVIIRTKLVPVVNFGSRAAFPILIIGALLSAFAATNALGEFGYYVVLIGLALYAGSTIFMLVTLPCEFNASRRAKRILADGILSEDEARDAGKVLNAAAKTYIASFALSLLQLIRIAFIFLSRTNRRR